MKKTSDFTDSTGNVFADLEYSNPEQHLAKARLTAKINKIIERRKLSQKEAAKLLGVSQPDISKLQRGVIRGFSMERLFVFFMLLGHDITVTFSKRKTKARSSVGKLELVEA